MFNWTIKIIETPNETYLIRKGLLNYQWYDKYDQRWWYGVYHGCIFYSLENAKETVDFLKGRMKIVG